MQEYMIEEQSWYQQRAGLTGSLHIRFVHLKEADNGRSDWSKGDDPSKGCPQREGDGAAELLL
jgi:hypothetical protein